MSQTVQIHSGVPVFFSKGKPSNFHKAPIALAHPMVKSVMVTFDTNEHYFQPCKLLVIKGMHVAEKFEAFNRIVAAPSAAQAKSMGRDLPMTDEDLEEWNGSHAMVRMLVCNLAKYTQHEDCRRWLVDTGDRPLVEHRPDDVWGDNLDGSGQNLLGKTLELVRARVR